MQRLTGTSRVEGVLIDWVSAQPEAHSRVPVSWLDDEQVAAELARIQRDRARETAREAELILRLAELRPDVDDPAPFRMEPDGTLHVTSPSGITRTTRPPGLRAPESTSSPPGPADDPPPF